MPEDASRRWMTYAEIAFALGLPSAKAGESKARRSNWQRQIGNDGLARVAVPLSVLDAPPPPRRASVGPSKATLGTYEPQLAEALRRAAAEARAADAERQLAEMPTLLEHLGAARGEAAALREAVRHEREARQAAEGRTDRAEQGRDAERARADAADADRRAADARAERERERADRAEQGRDSERAHADALRQRLDAMQDQLNEAHAALQAAEAAGARADRAEQGRDQAEQARDTERARADALREQIDAEQAEARRLVAELASAEHAVEGERARADRSDSVRRARGAGRGPACRSRGRRQSSAGQCGGTAGRAYRVEDCRRAGERLGSGSAGTGGGGAAGRGRAAGPGHLGAAQGGVAGGVGQGVLDLVLQLGPCRVEPVGRRLLRVRGGSDQPEVVAAIRRAGGERDGTRQFWWVEARQLRALADDLRPPSDPLLRASQSGGRALHQLLHDRPHAQQTDGQRRHGEIRTHGSSMTGCSPVSATASPNERGARRARCPTSASSSWTYGGGPSFNAGWMS